MLVQAHTPTLTSGPLGDVLGRGHELHEAIRTFWGDGASTYCDLLILALRVDELYADDVEGLLAKFDEAAGAELGDVGLTSEDPAERAAVVERLNRLRVAPELRAAYHQLLSDT